MKKILVCVCLIAALLSSCATVTRFSFYDEITDQEIVPTSVKLDGEKIDANQSKELSNGIWNSYNYEVKADGYKTTTGVLKREIKIPIIVAAVLGGAWPALWVYGPTAEQRVYMSPLKAPVSE